MTRASLLRALESPLTYFPYVMTNEANFDDVSENLGYRYNK